MRKELNDFIELQTKNIVESQSVVEDNITSDLTKYYKMFKRGLLTHFEFTDKMINTISQYKPLWDLLKKYNYELLQMDVQ